MTRAFSPYFDPEFDSLYERINGPSCRVTFDNDTVEDNTIVKIDCVKKQDQLLEVVQVLTEVNLTITKGYISSDAGWFMDVFHVKDVNGKKVSDQKVNYIQQAIDSKRVAASKIKPQTNKLYNTDLHKEPTTIEMTAIDRPGLFSEISAALADLHCNIVEAHAWSHNARLACVAYISDQSSDTRIDNHRLANIEHHLNTILHASNTSEKTSLDLTEQKDVKSTGLINAGGSEGTMTVVERRLHQLLLSVHDFDVPHTQTVSVSSAKASVLIENCDEKGYSIVTVQCKDRRRLMFDTVCTLADMQYVISHASVNSHGGSAFQEYFVRKIDGGALSTEREKQHATKCLEAAVERRVCEGTRLQLCANDRVGLLSDITRVLREKGLVVLRADLATKMEKYVDITFYVRDVFGNNVDMELVKSMKREMGLIDLAVKNEKIVKPNSPTAMKPRFSIGDIFRSQIEKLSHSLVTYM
ncbi:ACT domain-containing protein ACR2 [Rutidosis leptorrhynchoides]|uniref:ACT domain-containing protein ACR2 n=1 Tax=Rutidosis leptorrhynchoides TaxID=125765 RepID=UPI003A99340A